MEHVTQVLNRYPWAELLVTRTLHVLVLAFVVLVSIKVIHAVSRRILTLAHHKEVKDYHEKEREKRIATLVKLVDTTLTVILLVAALLMGLREFGLDITPLLTGAGIAGVAVGFGAQSLVKDVISGFFLLLEDQIRVGDAVRIGGLSGSVERMELRITALRDGDGTLHVIPNGEIKSVSNMTYDFATAVVTCHVPYHVELKTLLTITEGVVRDFNEDATWKGRRDGDAKIVGVTEFLPTGYNFMLNARTEPHGRWSVATELRNRIKTAADKAGIRLTTP